MSRVKQPGPAHHLEVVRRLKFPVALFQHIAKVWKGWSGVQEWASVEGEFGVSATCDNLGHIMLSLIFREFSGPELWDAKVGLRLDAGQTEQVAKKVSEFFAN